MQFKSPLYKATLIKRYKRFLADVHFEEGPDRGTELTIHCPNPGAMLGIARPGATVYASRSDNPKRKLAYTYELEEVEGPEGLMLVGINTGHPNGLAEEAIRAGIIEPLSDFASLRREVRYGDNSRIDILLEAEDGRKVYVEVKNVHLMRQPGLIEFPDSVTARGAKHLREMSNVVAEGHRAAMLYVSQWPGAERAGIARDLDPAYAAAADMAIEAGVEFYGLACALTTTGIEPVKPIPVVGPTS